MLLVECTKSSPEQVKSSRIAIREVQRGSTGQEVASVGGLRRREGESAGDAKKDRREKILSRTAQSRQRGVAGEVDVVWGV